MASKTGYLGVIMNFQAQAPANLAFIKYMGKASDRENTPTHSSLSWTLDHLTSTVQLEINKTSQQDIFLASQSQSSFHIAGGQFQCLKGISTQGQKRFLKHLEYLKYRFRVKQPFIVRSHNNFPADIGLASSASSFAALTKAFAKALKEIADQQLSDMEMAHLSRRGSGSACRSFFPGCLWRPDGELLPIDFPKDWIHIAVLVSSEKKHISSSQAHRMVLSSPLYRGRPQRAEKRLSTFITYLKQNNWKGLYQTVQEEFLDMMDLFHTSIPSFSYLKPQTVEVLNILDKFWKKNKDGPLVSMDAGPHIHLIWRQDQKNMISQIRQKELKKFPILSSPAYQNIF